MQANTTWQTLLGRAIWRSNRVVGALAGIVAYPLLMGGVDRMAVSEGPFEILLGALVSVWLGAVALFLCHELGDL
jgi:hypothetical protein